MSKLLTPGSVEFMTAGHKFLTDHLNTWAVPGLVTATTNRYSVSVQFDDAEDATRVAREWGIHDPNTAAESHGDIWILTYRGYVDGIEAFVTAAWDRI